MNTNQFSKSLEMGITLVDFNASWCAPCRAQEPVIKRLAKTYQDRIDILEINIDQHGELATKYRVQSIPTLILFKDGKEMKRFVGLQSESFIVQSLDDALSR
jgi:thioredoxin 1